MLTCVSVPSSSLLGLEPTAGAEYTVPHFSRMFGRAWRASNPRGLAVVARPGAGLTCTSGPSYVAPRPLQSQTKTPVSTSRLTSALLRRDDIDLLSLLNLGQALK